MTTISAELLTAIAQAVAAALSQQQASPKANNTQPVNGPPLPLRFLPRSCEAADFEVPSPVMIGRSPSGSRTARLSLRVDTLISIRFMT